MKRARPSTDPKPLPRSPEAMRKDAAETEATLRAAIRSISESVKRIEQNGLNYRAIVVLIADSSGVSKRVIGDVLTSLAELERRYTR